MDMRKKEERLVDRPPFQHLRDILARAGKIFLVADAADLAQEFGLIRGKPDFQVVEAWALIRTLCGISTVSWLARPNGPRAEITTPLSLWERGRG